MKKQLNCMMMAALCAASFIGCGNQKAAIPEPVQTESESVQIPQDSNEGQNRQKVMEFRLGEGSILERAGEVTFPLDGLLGVPEGENCPVVFILHGAHGPEDVTEDRFYQGFTYLAEELAQNGYFTVVINMNRAYSLEPFEGNEQERAMEMFRQYFSLLEKANAGEKVFPVDISGKADITKLNFIGHSRGGDNSAYIAGQLLREGIAVKSVLTVASPLVSMQETEYPDVPTGIIVSQYDGDVNDSGMAKVWNYEYFLGTERTSPMTMAFLYGGNHAKFNTEIPQEDFLSPPENVTYLDGEKQREFLKKYAVDFLKAFQQEGQDIETMLGDRTSERYQIDFASSVLLPNSTRILSEAGNLEIKENGMKAEQVVFTLNAEENTSAPFNTLGVTASHIPFYKLRWQQPGASVTLQISDILSQQNRKGVGNISLLLAADSTADESAGMNDAVLEVELSDREGKTAFVRLDRERLRTLAYQPVTIQNVFEGMEDMPEYFLAEQYTPFGTVSLALSEFSGINTDEISSITLRGIENKGAVVLGGIRMN